MKKCVKCKRKYDDSVLKCPKCDRYLLKDTIADTRMGDTAQSAQRGSAHDPNGASRGNAFASRSSAFDNPSSKRRRVEPVDRYEETDTSSPQLRDSGEGFRPSTEPVWTASGSFEQRKPKGRTRSKLLRRIILVLRYTLPAALILVSILFIVLHWNIIYDLIQHCIIGGMLGGVLLTFLSIRGHRYSIEATIVGIIGGMATSCILAYNLFNVTSELGALFYALGPCLIIIAGIFYLFRSLR